MLFELIKPYKQHDLLATLADHLSDESSRWESRMQQNEEAALIRGIVRGNRSIS